MPVLTIKLHQYEDNDAGIMFVSETYDYGVVPPSSEFMPKLLNLVFVLRIEDPRKWADPAKEKYHVEAGVVCEAQVGENLLAGFLKGIGVSEDEWNKASDDTRAAELFRGGICARFFGKSGNNRLALRKEGHSILNECVNPKALDDLLKQPQNRAGATGYDWLRGDFEGPTKGMSLKQIVEHLGG